MVIDWYQLPGTDHIPIADFLYLFMLLLASSLKSQLLIKLFPPFPLPWLWRSKLSKVGKSEGNKDAT
jgi:hypothetical protein